MKSFGFTASHRIGFKTFVTGVASAKLVITFLPEGLPGNSVMSAVSVVFFAGEPNLPAPPGSE